MALYFILSSEFNAYLNQIKVLLSTVIKYCIFSPVENTIYIFSRQQTEAILTIGALFLLKKSWNASLVSGIKLRTYARQIKQLTSHFDVT